MVREQRRKKFNPLRVARFLFPGTRLYFYRGAKYFIPYRATPPENELLECVVCTQPEKKNTRTHHFMNHPNDEAENVLLLKKYELYYQFIIQ